MKSLSKNYLYNLSYQLFTLLIPLITMPYIARTLGVEAIGEYSFSYSIVAYFILLAQFGITNFAQREIAYHQSDIQKRSCIFFEVCIFQIITVAISLTGYCALGALCGNVTSIYWLQALHIMAVMFDVTWFFQGLEEFGKIVFRNFLVRFVNIALLFLLIKSSSDLTVYTLIMGGMNIISGILICFFLKNYIHRVPLKDIHPFRNLKAILGLFLPQVAIQIYVVLDKTMLGLFTNAYVENGYYEQADRIIKVLLVVATSLGAVMLPRIAVNVAKGEVEVVKKYMMLSYRYSFMITIPMCLGIMGTASNFVPWFFGAGYEPVIRVLSIISSMLIAVGLSNVTGIQFMIPTNRQNQLTLSVIVGAIFNFTINLYLIPHFGVNGVAVATVLTEWLVTIVQLYMVHDFFSFKEIIRNSVHYVLGGLIMFGVIMTLSWQLQPSIINTLILIVAGGGIYIGVLLLLKDSMILFFCGKIKQLLCR